MPATVKVIKPTVWYEIDVDGDDDAEGFTITLSEDDARSVYYALKSHFDYPNHLWHTQPIAWNNNIVTTNSDVSPEELPFWIKESIAKGADQPLIRNREH